VLRESCAAHGASPQSSLIVAGRGGLRQDPEVTLPALYIANRPIPDHRQDTPLAPIKPSHTSINLSASCG
jgi:hypothetical protein